jgi:hypothetical protein
VLKRETKTKFLRETKNHLNEFVVYVSMADIIEHNNDDRDSIQGDHYSIATIDTQENNARKQMREDSKKYKKNVFLLKIKKDMDFVRENEKTRQHTIAVFNTDAAVSSYVVNATTGRPYYDILIGSYLEKNLFKVRWIDSKKNEPDYKKPLHLYFETPSEFEHYFMIHLSHTAIDRWRTQCVAQGNRQRLRLQQDLLGQ